MIEARCAVVRLMRAETKYDQRIIGALVLAFAWVSFWQTAERMDAGAGHAANVTTIELKRIVAP